jgi:hypothetical protein
LEDNCVPRVGILDRLPQRTGKTIIGIRDRDRGRFRRADQEHDACDREEAKAQRGRGYFPGCRFGVFHPFILFVRVIFLVLLPFAL